MMRQSFWFADLAGFTELIEAHGDLDGRRAARSALGFAASLERGPAFTTRRTRAPASSCCTRGVADPLEAEALVHVAPTRPVHHENIVALAEIFALVGPGRATTTDPVCRMILASFGEIVGLCSAACAARSADPGSYRRRAIPAAKPLRRARPAGRQLRDHGCYRVTEPVGRTAARTSLEDTGRKGTSLAERSR